MKTALAQPNGDNTPLTPINLQPRDQVVAQQIGNALSIFHAAANTVVVLRGQDYTEKEGGAQDGGVLCAVESLLISTCNRLEDMINDNERFSFGKQNALEAKMTEIMEARLRLINASADEVKLRTLPHTRFQPGWRRLPDGSFVVWIGNPQIAQNFFSGRGPSLAQALQDFDEKFLGLTPETQTQLHEQHKMDIGGNQNSNPPAQTASPSAADSAGTKTPGPDSGKPHSGTSPAGETPRKKGFRKFRPGV